MQINPFLDLARTEYTLKRKERYVHKIVKPLFKQTVKMYCALDSCVKGDSAF